MSNRKLKILCITGITTLSILLIAFVCWIYFDNDNDINNELGYNNMIARTGDNNEKENLYAYTPLPSRNIYANERAEGRISSDTEYILQNFYVDSRNGEELTEEELPVPAEFIALNKSQLQKYLDDYVSDMPLEEYLNGMISYEIISFDDEKLILRKTYGNDAGRNNYYLRDSDGEVVVYYGDKKTVYEYTGINTEDLPAEDRIRLRIGYYVANVEELYAMLESYSS